MPPSTRWPWYKFILPVLLALLVIGPLALVVSLLRYPRHPPTASQLARRPQGVTRRDYEALGSPRASRTSYAETAALLGEGTLLDTSADGRTRTYQWYGGGRWAKLEVTFRDGYLVSKQQAALSR